MTNGHRDPADVHRADVHRPVASGGPAGRDTGWRESAACRSEDPELFFPLSSEGAGTAQAERAKAVCARCPVVSQCAAAAMTVGEAHGIWGGMDERERRHLSRAAIGRTAANRSCLPSGVVRAAEQDVRSAAIRLPGSATWLDRADPSGISGPLVAEVWVFDPVGHRALLVDHPWRGLVPPGGKAEPGETPRRAAVRELFEETGLSVVLMHRPAMAFVRRFREDSSATTLGFSYAAFADPAIPLCCEPGQPAAWFDLSRPWAARFPKDRQRMRWFLDLLLRTR